MAITVINGGTFPQTDVTRPGLYVRFVEKAIAAIGTGSRSKVATVKKTVSGEAVAGKIYRVKGMADATRLFGVENVKDIERMFVGGASEVVVGVTDAAGLEVQATLELLETYDFHIFYVQPGFTDLATKAFAWMKLNRTNGKNFIGVFSNDGVETVQAITTASAAFKDEYSVYVPNGVYDADGAEVGADEYAAYIAGLIAGTALDGSLTYFEVPFPETIRRYRAVEIQELLELGVLLTVMDGDTARIEQGLTLGTGQFAKIRTVRAKQAMIDDIDKAVKDNYVGKITNNPDGQIAVLNGIKAYLETLASGNVIAADFTVELDKTVPSVGSELYINIAVRFLDSIEYVYLTITL